MSIGQAATLAGLAHAPSRDNPQVSLPRARVPACGRARANASAGVRHDAKTSLEPKKNRSSAARARRPFSRRISRRASSRGPTKRATRRARTAFARRSTSVFKRSSRARSRTPSTTLGDRGVGAGGRGRSRQRDRRSCSHGSARRISGTLKTARPTWWCRRVNQGPRSSPSSTALAFDRGFTAATVLPDFPNRTSTSIGAYRPRDYDRRFRGPVRAREALASSYNVPAVELASRLGASSLLQTLRSRRLRIARARRRLLWPRPRPRQRRRDVVRACEWLSRARQRWRVASVDLAAVAPGTTVRGNEQRVVSAVGERDRARHPRRSRGAHARLRLRDAVRFPVSRRGEDRHEPSLHRQLGRRRRPRGFTVAVWAGNFNGHPMEGVSGVTGAGPLLHRAVMATAKRIQPGVLTTPSQVGAVSSSGLPALRSEGHARAARGSTSGSSPARNRRASTTGSVTVALCSRRNTVSGRRAE